MCLLGSEMGIVRVATCSMDKTVVLFDVLHGTAGKICLRISLPDSLLSIATNPLQDVLCVGSNSGSIYIIDLSVSAIAITASHSTINYMSSDNKDNNGGDDLKSREVSELKGHSKKVTSVSFSLDNITLGI